MNIGGRIAWQAADDKRRQHAIHHIRQDDQGEEQIDEPAAQEKILEILRTAAAIYNKDKVPA